MAESLSRLTRDLMEYSLARLLSPRSCWNTLEGFITSSPGDLSQPRTEPRPNTGRFGMTTELQGMKSTVMKLRSIRLKFVFFLHSVFSHLTLHLDIPTNFMNLQENLMKIWCRIMASKAVQVPPPLTALTYSLTW